MQGNSFGCSVKIVCNDAVCISHTQTILTKHESSMGMGLPTDYSLIPRPFSLNLRVVWAWDCPQTIVSYPDHSHQYEAAWAWDCPQTIVSYPDHSYQYEAVWAWDCPQTIVSYPDHSHQYEAVWAWDCPQTIVSYPDHSH